MLWQSGTALLSSCLIQGLTVHRPSTEPLIQVSLLNGVPQNKRQKAAATSLPKANAAKAKLANGRPLQV